MRWLAMAVRVVFIAVLLVAPMIVPQTPLWHVAAGIAYVIGILLLVAAFFDEFDIVELALYGLPGQSGDPLTPRTLLSRALVILIFWFIVIALGLVLLPIPLIPRSDEAPVSRLYLLTGTLAGTVMYLAAVGWYRKSMRRRYGY